MDDNEDDEADSSSFVRAGCTGCGFVTVSLSECPSFVSVGAVTFSTNETKNETKQNNDGNSSRNAIILMMIMMMMMMIKQGE